MKGVGKYTNSASVGGKLTELQLAPQVNTRLLQMNTYMNEWIKNNK